MTLQTFSRLTLGQRTFCRVASVWVCCVILLLTVVSCGKSGPPRYELSGTITFHGKPVPAGEIRFEPIGSVVNITTIGEAEIKDGKYSTILNKGIIGGRQKVYVSGYNGIPEPGSGPRGASIFDVYIMEIKLPEEPSTFDVVVPDGVRALRKF